MSKIHLMDSRENVIRKMSQGNPRAMRAIIEIIIKTPSIDPENILDYMGPILLLDTLEIYGPDIYILWNGQCDGDTRELLMLLRANQLGFINGDRLKKISADQTKKIKLSEEEMDSLNEKVCEKLRNFQPRVTSETS